MHEDVTQGRESPLHPALCFAIAELDPDALRHLGTPRAQAAFDALNRALVDADAERAELRQELETGVKSDRAGALARLDPASDGAIEASTLGLREPLTALIEANRAIAVSDTDVEARERAEAIARAASSLLAVLAPRAEARRAPACTPERVPARVLVVEDDDVNRVWCARLVRHLGYQVDAVASGAQALASIERGAYAMVLLDVQMPGMGGLEVARTLRAARNDVPIVALTASSTEGDRERCLAAGMNDYLAKPVSKEQLDRCLARWTRSTPSERAAAVSAASDVDPRPLDFLRELPAPAGEDPFSEIVELYALDVEVRLVEIAAAARSGDAAAVRFAAHAVKGASANIGLHAIARAAAAIERAPLAQVTPLLGELELAFRGVASTLRAECEARKASA